MEPRQDKRDEHGSAESRKLGWPPVDYRRNVESVVKANTQESESYDYKRESFKSAKFVGHIKPGMKFNRNGELEMTISVPFEYRDAAQLVSYIFDEPMVIEVQKWDGNKIEWLD